ncbi:MAG: haloacid dehalogenase type II [Burkholderiales bacterium]
MSNPAADTLQILAFDVFGTVVDWHGSIAREVDAMQLGVDGGRFALAWRAGYLPAMERVRKGELGWTRIDDLHRMILDSVLTKFGIRLLPDRVEHLNKVWHRLDPWPDTLAGLHRLRSRYTLCTLSNGNLGLLANMAKRAALPWDLILSAEVFRHYKPDPQTYLGVADIFGVSPGQVMLVAAHKEDLHAAAACGLRTAFVTRPMEFGPTRQPDISREPAFDHHATDFLDLADQLGC